MGKKPPVTLDTFRAYARSHPKSHRPCWACSLPERDAIDQAKREGVMPAIIRGVLLDQCGYAPDDATLSKLNNHFQNRHHLRDAEASK